MRDLLVSLPSRADSCWFCGSGHCTFSPELVGSCMSEDSGHVVTFEIWVVGLNTEVWA